MSDESNLSSSYDYIGPRSSAHKLEYSPFTYFLFRNEKRKNKCWWIIVGALIVLVIVVLLGLGLYFAFRPGNDGHHNTTTVSLSTQLFSSTWSPSTSTLISTTITNTQHETSTLPVSPKTCLPSTATTLFVGYSNDIDPQLFLDSVFTTLKTLHVPVYNFAQFANVRLDSGPPDESIQYHDNQQYVSRLRVELSKIDNFLLSQPATKMCVDLSRSFLNSIKKLLPAGSPVANPHIPSNSVEIVRKFLSNTTNHLCGAKIFMLLHRDSNSTDVSDVIASLQRNHAFVYATRINGTNRMKDDAMYDLTTQSNGFFDVAWYSRIEKMREGCAYFTLMTENDLFYSVNLKVSGRGTKQLPILSIPRSDPPDTPVFIITVSENGALDNFKYMNLTTSNSRDVPNRFSFDYDRLLNIEQDTSYFGESAMQQDLSFSVSLDYEFSSSEEVPIQIRSYIIKLRAIRSCKVAVQKSIAEP
ncbi:unnamed protein product [Caenorhabditis sp. 36 PRJEB53466]|nr:unnamed protein product [Caenorhabditis sp. 36 PRJEB53466]